MTAFEAAARWIASKPVAFRKVYASGNATPWHRASFRGDDFWKCGCQMHTGNVGPGRVEFTHRPVAASERCAWWRNRP